MTAAHIQRTTIHVVECVPSHEPREKDPHYHIFNETRARLKKAGLLKCWIGNADCAGQIELHHDKVEFSLQNGVDISNFAKAFPEFTGKTDEEFEEWIEGEGNLVPLCLTGETLVLMAGGTSRAIQDIRIGDEVIGHDLLPHLVTGTMSRFVSEDLTVIGDLAMTGNHPILTPSGWRKAETMLPGVVVAQVLRVGAIQPQVLDPIVGLVPVDVVDDLASREFSAKVLRHDIPMQHDIPAIHDDAQVAFGRKHRLAGSGSDRTLSGVQSDKAAGVGAGLLPGVLPPDEGNPAHRAGALSCMDNLGSTLVSPTASIAARDVSLSELSGDGEIRSAVDAFQCDRGVSLPLLLEAGWSSVNHVEKIPFQGIVFDIEVAGSSSFIAAGVVVHNCKVHHVGILGVHVIPYPLWLPQKFWKAGMTAPAHTEPAGSTNQRKRGQPVPPASATAPDKDAG